MLIFDGPLRVEYRQFYVLSDDDSDWSAPSRDGQSNGLCGAAIPGVLFCTTATHYGSVGLRVELLDAPPSPDSDSEEVVEVSFKPNTSEVRVQEWDGDSICTLPLEPRWYRVRYAASGFAAARAADSDPDRDFQAITDRYHLTFWPEDAARSDEVVRVTSDFARIIHTPDRRG